MEAVDLRLPRRLKLMCMYPKRHHPHFWLLEVELDVEEALWHISFNFPHGKGDRGLISLGSVMNPYEGRSCTLPSAVGDFWLCLLLSSLETNIGKVMALGTEAASNTGSSVARLETTRKEPTLEEA
jgi:hypothetical protein